MKRVVKNDENEKRENKIPQYVTERIFGVGRREPRYP